MFYTFTDFSHLPYADIDDPEELRLPLSWANTPLQNAFNSSDPLHYRHPSTINNTTPLHPFSKYILFTCLSTHTPCVFQHYIPDSSIDMTKYTIDWPCGCTRPKTLQLTLTDCQTLFPHICQDTPTTPLNQLCPQCRLGCVAWPALRSSLTPIAYLALGSKWFRIKARRYGERTPPPKSKRRRSQCGSRTPLTDRKYLRSGRKRTKS